MGVCSAPVLGMMVAAVGVLKMGVGWGWEEGLKHPKDEGGGLQRPSFGYWWHPVLGFRWGWGGGLQCHSVGDNGSCCWGPKGGGPIGAGSHRVGVP